MRGRHSLGHGFDLADKFGFRQTKRLDGQSVLTRQIVLILTWLGDFGGLPN